MSLWMRETEDEQVERETREAEYDDRQMKRERFEPPAAPPTIVVKRDGSVSGSGLSVANHTAFTHDLTPGEYRLERRECARGGADCRMCDGIARNCPASPDYEPIVRSGVAS